MNYLEQHGRTLVENGFRIVPILAGTKAPDAGKGWQNVTATTETVDSWLSEGRGPGVGVLTRDTPAVDLDLSHQPTIDALQSWCDEHIGRTPHRIGRPPRRLLVFRTATPFAKKRLEFRTETGEKQLVEVLGNGQQFVAFATHPDTKQPYAWPAGNLAEMHVDFLPTITETLADDLLAYFESVAPDTWEIVSRSSKPNEKPTGINLAAPLDRVAAALDVLPNDERHYDEWIRIGHAIKAATNDSWEGRELFHDWSKKADKYDYRETERAWDSIHEAKHIGAGTIFREAMQHGFQMPPTPAAAEFDAIDYVMPSAALQRQFDVQVAEWEAGAAAVSSGALTAEQRQRIADDVSQKLLAVAQEAGRGRRRFLTIDEMRALPAPRWLVDGVIGERTAVLLFGASNTFKSFIAIDLGLSVSAGVEWHGRQTRRAKVGVVATEGADGVGRLRIPGWFDHYDIARSGQAGIGLLKEPVSLDSKADVDWLVEQCRANQFELLILDILKGTIQGSEIEDTTAAAWVQGAHRIIRETGTTVLAVAHSGWQDKTRARMHTHLWGSFDTRLMVEADKDALTASLSVERHKDADSTGSWGFRLAKSHGTLVPILDETVTPSKASKLSQKERIAIQALDDVLGTAGEAKIGDEWPPCRVVSEEVWRRACIEQGISGSSSPRARNQAFTRTLAKLTARGAVRCFQEHYWSTFDA